MTLATIFFRLLGSTSVYNNIINNIYVDVNSLSQGIFVFLLFSGMVVYDSKVERKEKYKLPKKKN